jgi:hypothetical protein
MPLFLIPILSGLKAFFGPILKAFLDWRILAVLAGAGAVLWGVHEMRRADAAQTQIKALAASLAAEHASFAQEQATLHALIAARTGDHHDAVKDATDTGKVCEARVAKARRTSADINTLIEEPAHAPVDPAEPELFGPGQLRHAIGR